MFTDTHCHLFKEYYDNLDEIIRASLENNVNRFINNGCDKLSNIEVLDTINKYENVYGALGIHPENVLSYTKEDLAFLEENLSNEKIIAIGEIGLDYHYSKKEKEEQILLLELLLQLATKYNKSVIIHSRDATLDTINVLKKYNVKGVIHSFSGSLDTAKEYIKMGFLLGINGVITFKNSNLKDVIKEIPLDYIVLETDAPYLTPEPFRGLKNDPSNIIYIAKFISELKGITLDELSTITNSNIKRLYNI